MSGPRAAPRRGLLTVAVAAAAGGPAGSGTCRRALPWTPCREGESDGERQDTPIHARGDAGGVTPEGPELVGPPFLP